MCYSDPGMSNANMQFAVVRVDVGAPENRDVVPQLEARPCRKRRSQIGPRISLLEGSGDVAGVLATRVWPTAGAFAEVCVDAGALEDRGRSA